ncbi:unnamed protein product, partial [Symbiodinium microadriaticum]
MFEDWSAQLVSGGGKELFAKDGCHGLLPLPLMLGRRNVLWMKSARLVSLFLSLLSIATGLICWSRFSAIHAGYVHDGVSAGISFNVSQLSQLSHLVMVAGHAVVMADSLEHIVHKESDWFLEAYQRGQDLPQALVSHIKAGVEAAALDPRALLIFSGGQTRAAAGPRNEGWSYYRVAEYFDWWGYSANRPDLLREAQQRTQRTSTFLPVAQRAVTEEFALDSFQNVLFSLCRFKEVVGRYPDRVTIVSFTFKKQRFSELHRGALRFPSARFSYIGIQPPPGSRFDVVKAESGEHEAAKLFQSDPYGCHSQTLVEKRRARNPFQRTTPYLLSCPELKALLQWCGPDIFRGALPWGSQTEPEKVTSPGLRPAKADFAAAKELAHDIA